MRDKEIVEAVLREVKASKVWIYLCRLFVEHQLLNKTRQFGKEWDASKHPRRDDGKFGTGGSGSATKPSGSGSTKPTKPGSTKPSSTGRPTGPTAPASATGSPPGRHYVRPTDATAQRHAEANQERLAKSLPGARAIPGNAPSDVEREGCHPQPCHRHQLELKTLLTSKRGSVRMTSAAQARKLLRRDDGPPPPVRRQWSVVIDHRDAYGKGELDKAPTFPLYVREGTGSFNVSSMYRVENADELNTLLNTPPEKLPDKAKAPDTGFYAEWVKADPKKRQAMAQAAFKREKARAERRERRKNEPLR